MLQSNIYRFTRLALSKTFLDHLKREPLLLRQVDVEFFAICHDLLAEKPRIIVPSPVMRTVRNHVLWCSSEGSPPINISLLKNSTSLANGIGIAIHITKEEGLYTCVSSNEAGSDSKEFPVTFVGASLNSHTSNVKTCTPS